MKPACHGVIRRADEAGPRLSLHVPSGTLHGMQCRFIRRQACFMACSAASCTVWYASWHAVPLHAPSGALHGTQCRFMYRLVRFIFSGAFAVESSLR